MVMMAPPPSGPEDSAVPIVAGVMFLLAFLIALGTLQFAIAALTVGAAGAGLPFIGGLFASAALLGVLLIVGFVGCLMGMIFSFMKRNWMLAVIGGVLALVGLHLLFGLIGFILVLISKKAFKN